MSAPTIEKAEARLAWALMLPAIIVIVAIAVVPLGWTFWESLHFDDLRMPWLGRPLVGPANYFEAVTDTRFRQAIAHTVLFTAVSVPLQLLLGLILALAMSRAVRGRGLLRVSVLLPWSIPTVVVALLWRFMFDSQSGIMTALLADAAVVPNGFAWFVDPRAAWVPVILADVWKMTPFVALLLLAGLEGIDRSLYEAASLDGAGAWQQFTAVTLPLLRPAMTVAVLFRALDGLRVFDLIFVLTAGGPGTATEPISLYTFNSLLQNLRFGFGSALAIITFGMTFAFALAYIRLLGRDLTEPAK